MIVKENVTLYRCEFCKKELKVPNAMLRHEKYCGANPMNRRPCDICKHLEYTEGETIEIHFEAGGNLDTRYEKSPNYWYCNKLNKKVYNVEAEKRRLPEKYPETFEDQEPMPKECEFKQI